MDNRRRSHYVLTGYSFDTNQEISFNADSAFRHGNIFLFLLI